MEDNTDTPPAKAKSGEKSQLKKISFWAGLFRNFFTIIASIVSVATLFILIRQNENTYRPDLEISAESPVFEIRYQNIPANCSDLRVYNPADSALEAISLRLVNLGMGAAKDLALQWLFDPKKMRDTAQFGTTPLPTDIRFDPKIDMLIFGNCLLHQDDTDREEYLLPVNQARQSTTIDLPAHFLIPWSNLLIRTAHLPTGQDSCIESLQYFCKQFGRLELKTTYTDINRKKHRKQFYLYLAPKYIDLEAGKIICLLRVSGTKDTQTGAGKQSLAILFPDRTFRRVEID